MMRSVENLDRTRSLKIKQAALRGAPTLDRRQDASVPAARPNRHQVHLLAAIATGTEQMPIRGDADVAIAEASDVRITARLQPRRRGRRIDMLRLDAAACWELASVNQPSVRSLAFA